MNTQYVGKTIPAVFMYDMQFTQNTDKLSEFSIRLVQCITIHTVAHVRQAMKIKKTTYLYTGHVYQISFS